ncbi:MAG: glycosyltransferase family 4 protein [Actinomycetota bacterium]
MSGRRRRALLVVENESVPHDRRVLLEARTLVEAGWDVTVVCPRKPATAPARERMEGIDVVRFGLREADDGVVDFVVEYALALVKIGWHALRLRARGRIDVVHLSNPPDVLVAVGAPLRLTGAALVFDHHDLAPEVWIGRDGAEGGLVHRALLLAERLSMRLADVVISTNESYRRLAMSRGGRAAEDVIVVRNGPVSSELVPVDPDLAPPATHPHLLGYIGTMGPQDGVDHLIRALAHIVHDRGRTDVGAVLVGDGSELDGLRRLTRELGLDERVTFTGRVPHAEVARHLARVDVCVSPDPSSPLNDRSTMIKTLEYLALAKPIVAFDLTETRVSAADCALYATPDDVIELGDLALELIDDPERARKLGEAGRRRLEDELGWDRSAPRLLAAYDRALDNRSAGLLGRRRR